MEPREQILRAPGAKVQLRVTGRFSDGSTRDMTREVRYSVVDEAVTDAGQDVLVTAKGSGLTVVLARGAGKAATAQFIVIGADGPLRPMPPRRTGSLTGKSSPNCAKCG